MCQKDFLSACDYYFLSIVSRSVIDGLPIEALRAYRDAWQLGVPCPAEPRWAASGSDKVVPVLSSISAS